MSRTAKLTRDAVASPDEATIVVADLDRAAWDRYVEGHPDGTVDHLASWRDVIETVFGHHGVSLAAVRNKRPVGVLPFVLVRSSLFGRSAVSMPFLNDGGVLADDDVAARALIEQATAVAREFGATHLELRHRARRFLSLPFRQHKLGFTRALPATPDELWTDLDRKVRNQVRKAQKEGLVATTGGGELVDEFYAVFSENMRDLGTPVYPRALFHQVMSTFADRVSISIVRRGTEPIAGGVAIHAAGTVLVPWASSLRRYRALCPNMLLYWALHEQAIACGATRFDYGRSSHQSGAHHFKLQWGGIEEPLHWEYVMLHEGTVPDHGRSNHRFGLPVEIWKHLPLAIANAVGPRLTRHLP